MMPSSPAPALVLFAAMLSSHLAHAQDRFHDPKAVLKEHFWGDLYASGGKTFFCGEPFEKKTVTVTDSYLYAKTWMRDHLDCGTPWQCRSNSTDYQRMASDLHNIVPESTRFELDRGSAKFENLDDSVESNACGYKRAFGLIEPPDRIKGDIARAMLYMHVTYELPLYGDLNQLKSWNREDPPSDEEKERNLRISEIQGNENSFITYPSQAEIVTLP